MNKKQKIIVAILVLIVAIVSGYLGIYFSKKTLNTEQKIAEGIIIDKVPNIAYKPVLIKDFEEYSSLLKEYNINDIVFLTNNSFIEKDYIVDFIDYSNELEITDITINYDETTNSIAISYYTNLVVKDSKKFLMYFIPIEKGLIDELNIGKREIKSK